MEFSAIRRLHTWLSLPANLRTAEISALAVAFMLRLAWGILVPVVPMADCGAYDTFAWNIASGNGFCFEAGQPTAYWPVGTAAVYALFYLLFGHHYLPIVLFNVLLGVGSVALSMSLARRWLGEIPAVITGWLLAVWPLLVEYTTVLASEQLFNFFVLLAFWVATHPCWKWLPRSLLTGVSLAAACYIRPIALLITPLAFVREAVLERRFIRAIGACMVSCVVMIALILPWSLRNQHVFGKFVLMSTNAGANFWMGNNPQTTGDYMELPPSNITNEVDRDHELNRIATEYIRQHPAAFVLRTMKKAVQLHDRESIGIAWNADGIQKRYSEKILKPLKLLTAIYWWIMLAGALFGALLLLRHRHWLDALTLPPLTAWAYFIAVHSIVVSGDRYHMPSIPYIAMLAAYAFFYMTRGQAKHS